MGDPCTLALDPHTVGAAIRTGLYALIVLGWYTHFLVPKAFPEIAKMIFVVGTGFLIMSFIKLVGRMLTLFDGLIISLLSTIILIFGIALCLPTLSFSYRPPTAYRFKLTASGRLAYIEFIILWVAWCISIWHGSTPFRFRGDTVNCIPNHHITFPLPRQVHAANPNMRKAALLLTFIGYLVSMWPILVGPSLLLWLFSEVEDQEYRYRTVGTVPTTIQFTAIGATGFLIVVTERVIQLSNTKSTVTTWIAWQAIVFFIFRRAFAIVKRSKLDQGVQACNYQSAGTQALEESAHPTRAPKRE
ncbi:hypothetical protein RSOLAG22IIIB_12190 [Rhizoctonia solani]|uniref:Uncharacterized protein n=1 Tax=Rhizoctonia solani TaxID=456999 RepID=A0A0K6GCG9_9AGAM|nr:hypothetical protein RSOLAG22IIIB_12190 [Rhizoctonia solani]